MSMCNGYCGRVCVIGVFSHVMGIGIVGGYV